MEFSSISRFQNGSVPTRDRAAAEALALSCRRQIASASPIDQRVFHFLQLALIAKAMTAAAIAALRLSARPAIGIFTSMSHSAS